MRIIIRDASTNLDIPIPTDLALNPVTAHIGAKLARKSGQNVSVDLLNEAFRVLKQFKKSHPDLPLVEVESGEDVVRIEL